MKELFLGEYIRQERLKQGVTQEQLCEGICEPITVSRMENDKQTPSYNRIRAFLQRLSLPDDRYFAVLSENELEIKGLQDEIRADAVRFSQAVPENQPDIQAAGLQKLERLECLAEPDDRIIRQFILTMKITFGKPDGSYSSKEALEGLLEALHITVPNCNPETFNLGLSSLDETSLIYQIAYIYAKMGQSNKALDIYRHLFKYTQSSKCETSRYAEKFALIALGYTRTLLLTEKYEDALEIAKFGQEVCVKYGHYQFLPELLALLGKCYFYNDELENCKEFYRAAYCLYKETGNDYGRLLIENEVKEKLDLKYPF